MQSTQGSNGVKRVHARLLVTCIYSADDYLDVVLVLVFGLEIDCLESRVARLSIYLI
jgi:hypothetical protein